MGKHYITPKALSEYVNFLQHVQHSRVVNFIIWVLERIAQVLGYPIYIGLPEELAELKEKPEALRAMRIVKRLQQAGYISSSNFYTSGYPDEPPSKLLIHTLRQTAGIGWNGKAAHTSDFSYLQWPALGEAVERYCLQHTFYREKELVFSSYASLNKPKADIFNISGFSKEEKSNNKSSNTLDYDTHSKFLWVPAVDAISRNTVYAPWQWFSFAKISSILHKENSQTDNEPLLSPPISSGAAAGQNKQDAILTGLLEVIERDAFMIYWLQQLGAHRIDLTTIVNKEVQSLIKLATDYHLELHVLYLETDAPVHTLCLVILDKTGCSQAVSVDAKSGFDVISIIADLLQDQLAQHGALHEHWEYNPDLRNVPVSELCLQERMLYWHRPERLEDISTFISGPYYSIDELPSYNVEADTEARLQHLYSWCKKNKYPVYYREIISPELKRLTEGMSVVTVRVPNLQPLYVKEKLKATGGSRLQAVPVSVGYQSQYGPDSGYCKIPSPFV